MLITNLISLFWLSFLVLVKGGWSVMTNSWAQLTTDLGRCMEGNRIMWLHYLISTVQTLAPDVPSTRWHRERKWRHSVGFFFLCVCELWIDSFSVAFKGGSTVQYGERTDFCGTAQKLVPVLCLCWTLVFKNVFLSTDFPPRMIWLHSNSSSFLFLNKTRCRKMH